MDDLRTLRKSLKAMERYTLRGGDGRSAMLPYFEAGMEILLGTHISVPDGDFAMLVFEIGHRDTLSIESAFGAAAFAYRFTERHQNLPTSLCVSGYDDDPRPLHKITEVKWFVQAFWLALMSVGASTRIIDQLDRDSVVLVGVCCDFFRASE